MASYKYIPEFMRARSEASKAAWEKRWDRGTGPIGQKGKQYMERTYGPTVQPEKPLRRGGGGGGVSTGGDFYPEDMEDDFVDEYDDFDFWDSEY